MGGGESGRRDEDEGEREGHAVRDLRVSRDLGLVEARARVSRTQGVGVCGGGVRAMVGARARMSAIVGVVWAKAGGNLISRIVCVKVPACAVRSSLTTPAPKAMAERTMTTCGGRWGAVGVEVKVKVR